MSRRVLGNASILTGEELEITRGYLVIDGCLIDEVSDGSPHRRADNLKGAFVLPPFVNAHTHVMDSVAKELYIGRTQEEVVGPNGEKFRALDATTRVRTVAAARATLEDMLRTGTLAHCDFREGGAPGLELLSRASVNGLKSIALGRFSKISEFGEVLQKANGIGFPRIDTFGPRKARRISRMTVKAKKLLATHVAETSEYSTKFMREFGRSEVAQAIRLDCSFVVHATHASEEDFLKLRISGKPVVFCPRSNSLLGVGTPAINVAMDAGAEFFLGTDNAMVCQPDMFEELSFAWACVRRANTRAGEDEARTILRSATVGPLKLFDLPWRPIGEGERATFMVLARGNNLLNLSNIYSGLLNRARADNVRTIYLDGKAIIGQNTKKLL